MYLYLLAGLAVVLTLAVILGIAVHFALAIVFIAIYIGGLIYIVKKYQKENDQLLRRIHFNVCLLIRNENERLYSRYNLRAKVGYLSQWIEFHALSSLSVNSNSNNPHGMSYGASSNFGGNGFALSL